MSEFGAILLAAGSSSRLGRPKQLLNFQGETLVRRSARAALDANLRPVVVVVGEQAVAIREELAGLDVSICEHADWALGMGSSLRAGLRTLQERAPAIKGVAVLVCDQLFVTAELLTQLAAAREAMNVPMAAGQYAGGLGVPALFDRTIFPMLASLADREGARTVLNGLSQAVAGLPFPQGEIDIDTAADYERWFGGDAETIGTAQG